MKKEFYDFFANGKRYDLLKDGRFIYFKKETGFRDTAGYEFIYHISDSESLSKRFYHSLVELMAVPHFPQNLAERFSKFPQFVQRFCSFFVSFSS